MDFHELRIVTSTRYLICENIEKYIKSLEADIECEKERLAEADNDYAKTFMEELIAHNEMRIKVARKVIEEVFDVC